MTPPNPKTTDDLFAALDLAVFEQLSSGLFQPFGRLPEWLQLSDGPVDLADRFPLLELFLSDGESQSDIWSEPDPRGGELYLQAVATRVAERLFVVLRSLPQALFTYQQLAHDFELEKEKV
jgi:hypothetical protein